MNYSQAFDKFLNGKRIQRKTWSKHRYLTTVVNRANTKQVIVADSFTSSQVIYNHPTQDVFANDWQEYQG